MSIHEFTAKTTEDAIAEGLRRMGVTLSDVKVEILEEGAKGLFGLFGSKQARVRLTLLEQDDDMSDLLSSLSMAGSERPAKQERQQQQPKPAVPKAQPAPQAVAQAEKPAKTAEKLAQAERQSEPPASRPQPERKPRAEVRPQAEPKPQPERERRPQAVPAAPMAPVEPAEQLDPATPAGTAQQFLQQVTRMMEVPVRVEVKTDADNNLLVQMTGDTLGILIGRRGETLDALQYLTSLTVNRQQDDYIRVTLDTENYRAKREESLKRLAARMAARAVKTGRKVALEPMNPYERRILHASLQEHPGVTTHSEGEEPNRHVVITLKAKT